MLKLKNIEIMKSFLFALCLVTLGVVAGCNSSKSMAKLNDVKWVLETLNGAKVTLTDSSNEIFIRFDEVEKRVNGRAACNRFFGNYEMDQTKLKFSPMGATRMACLDMQKETEFFQMLDGVETYSIKDNILSFKSKGEVVATFKKGEEKEAKN